ncbi:hypothetical protein TWF281_010979 [Arthrobotrys megalospora]
MFRYIQANRRRSTLKGVGWHPSGVTSVKLCIKLERHALSSALQDLSIFSDVTALELHIEGPGGYERNLYVATFSLLSTLPYYDRLQRLSFKSSNCHLYRTGFEDVSEDKGWSIDEGGALDPGSEAGLSLHAKGKVNMGIPEQLEQYRQVIAGFDPANQKFLGPFLSQDHFIALVLSNENPIRFPKHLQSLEIKTIGYNPVYFLALVDCEKITNLALDGATSPIMDLRELLPTLLHLPNVKTLTLYFEVYKPNYIAHLPQQMPSLESLKIRTYKPSTSDSAIWLTKLPNFPNLVELELPWPRKYYDFETYGTFRRTLGARLYTGQELTALRKVVFNSSMPKYYRQRRKTYTIDISVREDIPRTDGMTFLWNEDTRAYDDADSDDGELLENTIPLDWESLCRDSRATKSADSRHSNSFVCTG